MGANVGGTALQYDLVWTTQFKRKSFGVAKRGLDGTIAISSLLPPGTATQQLHTFKFSWITRAQLAAIATLYRYGNAFTVVTSAGGNTLTNCLPVPFEEDGLKAEPINKASYWPFDSINGAKSDRFDGEFKVYVTI